MSNIPAAVKAMRLARTQVFKPSLLRNKIHRGDGDDEQIFGMTGTDSGCPATTWKLKPRPTKWEKLDPTPIVLHRDSFGPHDGGSARRWAPRDDGPDVVQHRAGPAAVLGAASRPAGAERHDGFRSEGLGGLSAEPEDAPLRPDRGATRSRGGEARMHRQIPRAGPARQGLATGG